VSELTLVAERNGQRLLDIINDILDIEKIESGTISMAPEVLAIDALVREAIVLNEGFGERFKVRFEARGELPGREVYVDRKRLLQVMTNLLSNARSSRPSGARSISRSKRAARASASACTTADPDPRGVPQPHFRPLRAADSTASRQKAAPGSGSPSASA